MIIRAFFAFAAVAPGLFAQQPSTQTENPQSVNIDRAVAEAIDHNLDLQAERLGITVAEAREITARLRPNPVLTVSGQTLNVFRNTYSSDSPLGPNAVTAHTDFVMER